MIKFPIRVSHILIFALLLRFIGIGQSLWLDEAISWKAASLGIGTLLTQFAPTDFHPPLYYLVLKFFMLFFGSSEFALRIPSILASIIASIGVYRCAQVIDGKAGKWAIAFFIFNPLVLYYSQESRMYMLNLALLSWLTYYFLLLYKKVYLHPNMNFQFPQSLEEKAEKELKLIKIELKHFFISPRQALKHYFLGHKYEDVSLEKHPLFMFNLLSFLAFLTFYGSIFYIVALVMVFFGKFRFKQTKFLLIGISCAFVLLLPLILEQYQNSLSLRSLIPHWEKVLGKANLRQLFLIPIKLITGRLTYENKIAYFLISLLISSMVLGSLSSSYRKNQLWIAFIFVILTWGFVISSLTPMLTYTRFLFLVIPLSLALAEEKFYYLKLTILVMFFAAGCLYLFDVRQHREDWKSLANSLPTNANFAMIQASSDPIAYYRPDLKIIDLLKIANQKNLPETLIVAPYVADIYNFPYQAELGKRGYYLIQKKSFHQLQLEYYSQIPPTKK